MDKSMMDNLPQEVKDMAAKPGMVLVDHSNIAPLLEEYSTVLAAAELLIAKEDPPETPFTSKYQARKNLDVMGNKLEANSTVLKLEGKGAIIKQELSWRLAKLRVKTGSIAWDVEEPHNTETDLNAACEHLFPGLVDSVKLVAPDLAQENTKAAGADDVDKAPLDDALRALLVPRFDLKQSLEDALKCLNLLGILWTGRENVTRGALYLKSAEHVYTALSLTGSALSNDIEDIHTHTLFYLAQCYGNLGNAPMSSKFCHLTLQRQLTPVARPAAAACLSKDGLLDWIKNSMALSDFYFSNGDFFLYRYANYTIAYAYYYFRDDDNHTTTIPHVIAVYSSHLYHPLVRLY
jgi:hypothetical protein